MDWMKTDHSYTVDVAVVHQTNVDNTLGSLRGVQLDDLTITENYYSDSRVQGKVTTIVNSGESDGYVERARLRVILSIPEENWVEELVTGYVSDIDEEYQNGYLKRTYTIEGTIWGFLNHPIPDYYTKPVGGKLIDCWTKLLKNLTKVQYDATDAKDFKYTANTIYEPGSMLSTILFEITSGYNRMDTNGHGVVTLKPYKAPSKQTPSRTIDYNDLTGLTIAPLQRNSEEYSIPNRIVVTATQSVEDSSGQSTQKTIAGSYDSPASNSNSHSSRGYIYGRAESYSGDLQEPTQKDLDAKAKELWTDSQEKGIEWTGNHTFADFHAGEVATLIAPTSANLNQPIVAHKVLVSEVSTNLKNFTQALTLKEV